MFFYLFKSLVTPLVSFIISFLGERSENARYAVLLNVYSKVFSFHVFSYSIFCRTDRAHGPWKNSLIYPSSDWRLQRHVKTTQRLMRIKNQLQKLHLAFSYNNSWLYDPMKLPSTQTSQRKCLQTMSWTNSVNSAGCMVHKTIYIWEKMKRSML